MRGLGEFFGFSKNDLWKFKDFSVITMKAT